MTPKQIATLQARAALIKRMVSVTSDPGGILRVVVACDFGPTVRYLIADGDAPLRIDQQCPTGQDPGNWAIQCDRVARVFEPLLADALGMPVRGRQTRHLAALNWGQAGIHQADCSASAHCRCRCTP